MKLTAANTALVQCQAELPEPAAGELRVKVLACGVCRTDLHVIDGELPNPKLPLVLGHEIIGRVDALGEDVHQFAKDEIVGIPWLGSTCGTCHYCRRDQENLCDKAVFTGYQHDGGYAEFAVADARFCFKPPDRYTPAEAAPLLCAGLIGWRSLKMTGEAHKLGLYGFGAAAHIIAQVASGQGKEVYAFTKAEDNAGQAFAKKLNAVWTGSSGDQPPVELDAAIIFAPVGQLVVQALKAVRKGGVVVCAGIHMSDIPQFSYDLLWGERCLRSVANLTRQDGHEFMKVLQEIPVKTVVKEYPLVDAELALHDLRNGMVEGAAILIPNS